MKRFVEIEVDFDYDYQPPEQTSFNYPGCDASIVLNQTYHNGLPIELAPSVLSTLKQDAIDIETIKATNDYNMAMAMKEDAADAFREIAAEEQAAELARNENQRGIKL